MIKLLIGGSPCTYWSIAQTKNRETTAEGLGWELFKNYLIAKEKFKPDFFLYENNKSAAQEIKDQIKHELGVWDGTFFMEDTGARYIEINSALVSAQNRQRFYVHNCGEVEQPKDRGILLKDVLDSAVTWRDKAYTIDAQYFRLEKHKRSMVAEPIECLSDSQLEYMGRTVKDGRNHWDFGHHFDSNQDKAHCITANVSKVIPYNVMCERIPDYAEDKSRPHNVCAEPLQVGAMPRPNGELSTPYAIEFDENGKPIKAINADGKEITIYEVKDGKITIKGKQYPIKLKDGFYIIRKLTVSECCRLQTLPDDYCRAVSASQAYKGIGNGWTAEVIIHILNGALKDVPRDEEIVVLSMYDGIGTGRYCLDKMGFTNVKYYAYEIDKYAKQVSHSNYPDIIQLGDAFQLRDDNWCLPQ